MRRIRAVAAGSLAVLLAATGCSRLSANPGSPAQPVPVSQEQEISLIRQAATRDAAQPPASAADVLALVGASANITEVPGTLAGRLAAAAGDGPEAAWDGCLAEQADTQVGDTCVYGDRAAKKTVVLYGDSHAGMWASALDVAGRRLHWKVVLLAKPACAVPMLHFWLEDARRQNTECDTWHAWAVGRIAELKPAVVVLTSLFTTPRDFARKEITEARWSAGMTATIGAVRASGARVVVLGDMPYLEQSAPECLAAHPGDVRTCGTAAASAVNTAHRAAERGTAVAAGATFLDPTTWFCTAVCAPIIGTMVVYQDQYHISATYSRYLSGVVAAGALNAAAR